jgi:hypothetical protein
MARMPAYKAVPNLLSNDIDDYNLQYFKNVVCETVVFIMQQSVPILCIN